MMKLPFLILHILSIPVKPFGCGYAALSLSVSVREYVRRWLCPGVVHLLASVFFRVFRGKNEILIFNI